MSEPRFKVGDEVIVRDGANFFKSVVDRITHDGKGVWVGGTRFRQNGSDTHKWSPVSICHYSRKEWIRLYEYAQGREKNAPKENNNA